MPCGQSLPPRKATTLASLAAGNRSRQVPETPDSRALGYSPPPRARSRSALQRGGCSDSHGAMAWASAVTCCCRVQAGPRHTRPRRKGWQARPVLPARPSLRVPLADHHAMLGAAPIGEQRVRDSGPPRAYLLCRCGWQEPEADGTRRCWFLSAPLPPASSSPHGAVFKHKNPGATRKQGSRTSRCRRSERWVDCAAGLECMGRLRLRERVRLSSTAAVHLCILKYADVSKETYFHGMRGLLASAYLTPATPSHARASAGLGPL